ncbi:MAG: T9SS type A sorting domain-containing protein [Bacteroidia bacterium]|nr:T9SS type A sorting domain-containing protein [Bacteroidia bacterium]
MDIIIKSNIWYIYQGNGNGTFTKKDSINLGLAGNTKLKDLTNDGLPDIVFDDFYSINLGNFKFSIPVNFLGSIATTFSDVYDFNNDGYNDIAAVRQNTILNICLNNQIGGFTSPITTTISGAPLFYNVLDLKVSDFDKDGMKDIILSGVPNIGFLKRTGPTSFNAFVAVSTASASKVNLADFNNDGYEDMIMSTYSTKDLVYFMSNGTSFTKNIFSLRNNSPGGGSNTMIALAELNGDSFIDVIAHIGWSNQSSMEFVMAKNNGNGTFSLMGDYKGFDEAVNIDAFDTNNDLQPEVILCQANNPNYNVNVCLNYGNANLNFPKNYSYSGHGSENVLTGDFDNDLDNEAIMFSLKTGGCFPFIIDDNNASYDTSYFDISITDSSNIYGYHLEKGDFNNDGLLDIVYTSPLKNRVGILINKGNLKFHQPVYFYLSARPIAITTGDFNSDSRMDIAVCYTNSSVFTAMLNNGGLSFTNLNTTSMASKNNGIAASDLNNDGFADIALIEDFNLRIYIGNGTGNFTLTNSYPSAEGLYRLRATDLNSDNNKDLVVCATFNNIIKTYFGNGAGSFTSLSSFVSGLPFWSAHADLNSDGLVDIVTGNNSNKFSILFGQGSNSYWPAQSFYHPEPIWGVEVSDLDNNGSQQIVFVGHWGASIYNTNGAFYSYKSPYTLCSGQSLILTSPSLGSGTSYTWMPGNITSNTISISSSGSFYLNYSNSNLGCTVKSNTVSVNTISVTPSNIIINGGPRTICGGDSVILNVNTTLKPKWNTGDTTINIVKFPYGNVIYQVNLVDSNGCQIKDTFMVNVKPLPLLNVSSTSFSVCSGNTVTLTATGASTFTWNIGPNTSSVNVSPVVATTYTVIGTNSLGCSSSNTITVNVNALPTITLVANNYTVCSGSNSTLTATGANTYSWSVSPYSNPKIVTPTITTTYTVWGTNSLNCTGTQTILINVNPKPTINVVASPSLICAGQTVTLTVSGANSYTWLPSGALSSSIIVSPISSTNYGVTGKDLNGCINSYNYMLLVNTCTNLDEKVSNIFENTIYPNPSNGQFYISLNVASENISAEVYNAVGELIFKEKITETKFKIDLNEQASGIYFIRIIENCNTLNYSKLIKQ